MYTRQTTITRSPLSVSQLGGPGASCPTGGSLPHHAVPGSAAAGGTWTIGPILAIASSGVYILPGF